MARPDRKTSSNDKRCTAHGYLPLRVGVSTRALFDLETEHAVFEHQGIEAYMRSQRDLEETRLVQGAGFEAISRLLKLNEPGHAALVEVVLLSRNAPDASLRAFAAMKDHGLPIVKGSFTSGGSIAPFLTAWGIDLFLSKDTSDVAAASAAGVAAAKLEGHTYPPARIDAGDLRIALDGDAVVFSDESDRIYARDGLQAFVCHEAANAKSPMVAGPFGNVLRKLAALRDSCRRAGRPGRIRIALVTARTAPAHARVVHTLRAWGSEVDEAHFVGDGEKAPVLAAFGAHIFFDDQERHVVAASNVVASAHVPGQSAARLR